ncbi:MAG: reprolysin-like metallopeptidase, partial [Bacteroidota bacterium]
MRRFIFVFFIILSHVVVAQESSLWTIPQNQAKVAQNSYLQARVGLNQPRLNEIVKEVSSKGSSQITIPLPDGEELPFTIMPTQLMAPELQRKHPEIKTFKGHNQNGDILRMDINSFGMHAMILSKSGKGTIYLDPASEFDADTDYISYYKKDYMNAHSYESPGCLNENMTAASLRKAVSKNRTEQNSTFFKFSVGENLRKYRMAVTAHPTFSSRTGNNNALATIVSVMNRITGIFENDMAITFEIVANNDELIYTNGNRGPFRNDDTLDQMRMKNQSNTDAVIGENNYEIGHIFGGSPFGGRAPAGSVCRSGLKAAGGSSSFFQNNRLDVFAVDLVAHEIGHQFGALHTFTSGRNCTLGADQFTQRDAYEMGSGSTIMSYIGLCGNNNIQDDVDDYYHTKSVQEMFKYLNSGQGGCAQLISTGNTPPTVTVAESGFSIPINTPFVLEADANDVNGDVLTYNWEQFDPATKMENMFGTPLGQFFTREELEAAGFTEIQIQAILLRQEQKLEAAFEGDGPLFRSFKAQRSNKRYFPRLSDVVADDTTRFEVLPFKTRDLNFVITVRDNNVSGGGVTNELLSFSSTMQAGPFLVTSQFTDAEYQGLTDVPLEWDVAGTDVAPVNCQLVDIFYSVDGGENFDILLKENTANDGSETITLPNFPTEKGRIMVKASDNVFFNVNKDDINVKSVDVEAPDAPTNLTASESTTAQVTLSWTDNSSTEDGFIIERQQGS